MCVQRRCFVRRNATSTFYGQYALTLIVEMTVSYHPERAGRLRMCARVCVYMMVCVYVCVNACAEGDRDPRAHGDLSAI